MVKHLSGAVNGAYNDTIQYLGQLMFGVWIKILLGAVLAAFTNIFFGDIVIAGFYAIFLAADLFLGVLYAKVVGTYTKRKLYGFVKKVVTCGIMLIIVGIISHSLFRITGVVIAMINWLMFVFILTEAVSIIDNLEKLGMPVHPVIKVVMKALRHKSASYFCNIMDTPEMVEELEKALGPDIRIVRRRADDTDDSGLMMREEFNTGDVKDDENHDN